MPSNNPLHAHERPPGQRLSARCASTPTRVSTSNAAAPRHRPFEALGCAPGMVERSLPPRDVFHASFDAHKRILGQMTS
jgi:hypothetical protein